ncbi:hypothetical protein WICPIJ_006140 [Wickerhamomyces pijperi]|uniref:Anaphase-promoting complex subunit 4 WD40 domain-containing protein n=1 Tax=Wickerhamomyces pijperi TaxID=599730 RepID=A0A9P8Q4U1_WICPI|nr:hypothetical protein WICPIJ_006140 [Wickerhamomyces pijperi]
MALVSGYTSSDDESDPEKNHSVTLIKPLQKVITNPSVQTSNKSTDLIPTQTNDQDTQTNVDDSKVVRYGSTVTREAFDNSTFERQIRKGHHHLNHEDSAPRRKKRKGQSFETMETTTGDHEEEGGEPSVDIDSYLGPWAKFEEDKAQDQDESTGLIEEEQQGEGNDATIQEPDASDSSSDEEEDQAPDTETTKLYIGSTHDYQNRSYLHPPTTTSTMVNLLNDSYPDICFPPSSIQHTYPGHTNGVTKLLMFPKSQHLLLSSGNDEKIYLWEVYGKRDLIRGYFGHVGAVKDICFNKSGSKFISLGMDKYVKIWDTVTGVCEKKLKLRQRGDVVKFIPGITNDDDDQFIVGLQSGKIEQYDLSKKLQSDKLALRYDGHLTAINDLQFFYPSSQLTTTKQLHLITCSSDKTMKIFTFGNPYPIKQISDPKLQAMTYLKPHPSGKFISAQSMNNTIVTIHTSGKFKFHKPKTFSGHHNVGYNINLDFSPNSQFLISGDANGEVYIWDWQTKTLKKRLSMGMNKDVKQQSKKCITQVVWNKKEVSSLVCAGSNGKIYLWG